MWLQNRSTCIIILTNLISLFTYVASWECFDPTTNAGDLFETNAMYLRQSTFSILPGWYNTAKDEFDSSGRNVRITPLTSYSESNEALCQRTEKGLQQRENTVNNLAQCPWRYVLNFDNDRIPDTILEAECLCGKPVFSRRKDGMICNSVVEYISVFRKYIDELGIKRCSRMWEPRTVACVSTSQPVPRKKHSIHYKTSA